MKVSKRLANGELPIRSRRQHGFTLIELMVSLLIGLVIMLGATQLFMTSRQSFGRVEGLGVRQGTLNFSVDILSRDIRRAENIFWDDDALRLEFVGLAEPGFCEDGELKEKTYYLKPTTQGQGEKEWSLSVKVVCAGETGSIPFSGPLVSGFVEDGLDADDLGSGLWELTLGLVPIDDDPDPEKITFRVMNRMYALDQ